MNRHLSFIIQGIITFQLQSLSRFFDPNISHIEFNSVTTKSCVWRSGTAVVHGNECTGGGAEVGKWEMS